VQSQSNFESHNQQQAEREVASSQREKELLDFLRVDNLIISMNSSWKAFFDTFVLFVVAYSIFTTLLYVSFDPQIPPTFQKIDNFAFYVFSADFLLSKWPSPDLITEYQDPENFLKVRDPKLIAQRYFWSGWMAIDFLATIPFDKLFKQDKDFVVTKLLRLTRLLRLWALLDQSKVNRLLKQLFENSERQDRIVAQYILMYGYKILRLIIIAIICTYFVGCLWFFLVTTINSQEDIEAGNTFVQEFGLDQIEDTYTKMIIACYFALTTLSTVGYGDMYPISTREMICCIFVMMVGIVFFSHIMGSFIEIISNYDKRMGSADKSTELHNWMTLLTRFTNNKPLPKQLVNQIDNHYAYYWANDRLSAITENSEFLNSLPRQIKRDLIKYYLFDDVFYRFRLFFNTRENKDSKFLYDVAFGLRPRRYDSAEEERLILDEEDEVTEMYFIQDGVVGIGYYLLTQGLSKKQFKLGIFMKSKSFICDYYVCFNKKSEFIFMVVQEVKAFALSKKFLLHHIFPKYPFIAASIKKGSSDRYKKNIRQRLLKYREEHVAEINKKSSYKAINVVLKSEVHKMHSGLGQAF
jgi:hypothetical protein